MTPPQSIRKGAIIQRSPLVQSLTRLLGEGTHNNLQDSTDGYWTDHTTKKEDIPLINLPD